VRITCLHTAPSNIGVFDDELITAGIVDVELHHVVRADLLEAAERDGGLTDRVRGLTVSALIDVSGSSDGVLLTCSTLGPAVGDVRSAVPVVRVDEALARRATAGGGVIVVLCAAPTTLEPTSDLFARSAAGTAASVSVRLVDGAWDRFKAGDVDGYHDLVASAADDARAEGADEVALAQASMAPAARRCSGPVLSSPGAGLDAIRRAVERSTNRR
jgi:hypothetical protein